MLYYNEGHTLLLDYFIPLIKFSRVVGRATSSRYESLMVHNMQFFLGSRGRGHC